MNTTIVVNAAKEVAESIRKEIDAQPNTESRLTERKNLDGDTAAWIVIATLAGQALPHILGFIRDLLAEKRVKKLKIGDWEVENPTPELVERFMATMNPPHNQSKKDA